MAVDGTIHDEPEDGDDAALTVLLEVDESLEPRWSLVKEALEGRDARIGATARAGLGVFQVDDSSASHLRWARGSALTHLSGSADVSAMLTHAHREARKAVFENPLASLKEVAIKAGAAVRSIGGANLRDPRPGLDPSGLARTATLVLHDGVVPATQLGLGSQRLASVAFQLAALESESVVLIDEVELGLEPHRLVHLLDVLRDRARQGRGQVMLTTHSPLVVEAVHASELFVARAQDGAVGVRQVPETLADMKSNEPQATIRSGPSAMLASRIIVCEGKTEVGMCRSLARAWLAESGMPLALAGTAFRVGSGNEAPIKARCLAELGYATALLHDDDLTKETKSAFDNDVARAVESGVIAFCWDPGCAVEDQVARSLPENALADLVGLAVELMEADDAEAAITAAVADQLGSTGLDGLDPLAWAQQAGRELADVRRAFGRAAHKKRWFKTESRGERLGDLVVAHMDAVPDDDRLRTTFADIHAFAMEGVRNWQAQGDAEP